MHPQAKAVAPNGNNLVSGELDRAIIPREYLENAMDDIRSFESATL